MTCIGTSLMKWLRASGKCSQRRSRFRLIFMRHIDQSCALFTSYAARRARSFANGEVPSRIRWEDFDYCRHVLPDA